MKSISVKPTMKPVKVKSWNGLNHCRLGVRWPGGAVPVPTLKSATNERRSRIVSSMPSSTFCRLAEISMPT